MMTTAPNRLRALFPPGWVLADGAWGTELHARGWPIATPPDLANLDRPGDVQAVARSYVEAGSQVILTNTFRSNRIALGPFGQAGRVRLLNQQGAAISRAAAGDRARVFGSIGPIGRKAEPDEARRAFLEQAETLAESGVDGLICETLVDLSEAALAIEAARSTGLPVVASFAAVSSLSAGLATRVAVDSGADAVGFNCGDPADASGWIEQFRAESGLPCWVKPSAGLPATRVDPVPQFGSLLAAWVEAGADFIGGCCGTTPGLVRALADGRRRDQALETTELVP